MSLCLSASGKTVMLAVQAFGLIWTHSVEKVEWRERWRVEDDGLVIEQAAVKGSGAGMEPADDARREGDWWVWSPMSRVPRIALGRSGAVADWRLCAPDCRPLGDVVHAAPTEPVTLTPCP
ncbi:DUF1850 domain-containing protein [Marinivivus vitaminiproducens]|uniref:DUF1850 domain-containing protein n=1 Tax=Marinivivus vitaminiproducens TaxID=3035935 RepID=UPI0027A9FFBC|nr:DUF1850 domain-containing protein [Geminicoccaceae bacterium SCSIO 64248]